MASPNGLLQGTRRATVANCCLLASKYQRKKPELAFLLTRAFDVNVEGQTTRLSFVASRKVTFESQGFNLLAGEVQVP